MEVSWTHWEYEILWRIENDERWKQAPKIERGITDELWKIEGTKRIGPKCSLLHVSREESAGERCEVADGKWKTEVPRGENDQGHAWKWAQKSDSQSAQPDEGCCRHVQMVALTRGTRWKQVQSHAREATDLLVWAGGERAGENGSRVDC